MVSEEDLWAVAFDAERKDAPFIVAAAKALSHISVSQSLSLAGRQAGSVWGCWVGGWVGGWGPGWLMLLIQHSCPEPCPHHPTSLATARTCTCTCTRH
jgi:hypothetical protein